MAWKDIRFHGFMKPAEPVAGVSYVARLFGQRADGTYFNVNIGVKRETHPATVEYVGDLVHDALNQLMDFTECSCIADRPCPKHSKAD